MTRALRVPRLQGRIPWAVSAVAALLVAVALAFHLQNRKVPGGEQFFDPVLPALALAYPLIGALLAVHRPRNPIGWICLGGGALLAVAVAAEQYALHALLTEPGGLPAGRWMSWLGTWTWVPGYLALWTALPLLLPDGHPPSPRWRPVLWAVLACIALATALSALSPRVAGLPASQNPVGIGGLPALAGQIQSATILVLGPICVAGLYTRYRRSPAHGRAPLTWLVVSSSAALAVPFAALLVGMLLGRTLPVALYQGAGLVALLSVPVALAVAIVRHRLYGLDIGLDTAVNVVVVYGGLLAAGAGAYLIVLAVAQAVTPVEAGLVPSLLAAVAVVLVWRQLRRPLQRTVDRLLYRKRDYDHRVLASLGQIVQSTMGPHAVLPAIVETVAQRLKLPHVAVSVGQGERVAATAAYGRPAGATISLPLVHQNEVVGRLAASPRSPEEPFDAADRRLLGDLAGQVGTIAYALCLTADLQVSRERLVTTREEERRRLRRDLHDGLQPALAGISLGLEAVGNMLGPSGSAQDLLGRLRDELQAAAASVRHLVYDLRPPALDELGLVGALRQQAVRFSLDPEGVDVAVAAPDDLPPLPAAVEVAAYRIGQEALENVRKHARAGTCQLSVELDGGRLVLEVRDDGQGLDGAATTGVGLLAMRERAAELGGTCSIESGAAGTCVTASLPVPVP